MRAYFFGNMYLSSIQQGIQAAHATAEMFLKYNKNNSHRKQLHAWASKEKTMILLNAGYSQEIYNLVTFFKDKNNPYPWTEFKESKEALDGAITIAGIILPAKIYVAAKDVRGQDSFLTEKELNLLKFTKWEKELIQKLNNYGVAK